MYHAEFSPNAVIIPEEDCVLQIWERDETVPNKDNWLSPSSFLSATEMRGSLRNNPSVLALSQQEVNNKYYMY